MKSFFSQRFSKKSWLISYGSFFINKVFFVNFWGAMFAGFLMKTVFVLDDEAV